MPTISRFYGIVIGMWFEDHPTPHFHAAYAEYEAKISINNVDVVKGSLPPRILRLVRKWAVAHRQELMDNWELARAHQPLKRIEPLP
jgi:hypothetical protein